MKFILATVLFVNSLFVSADVCKHISLFDRYDNVRILPVTILSVDTKGIRYKFEGDKQIVYGDVYYMKTTKLPKDLHKNFSKHRWMIYYCVAHRETRGYLLYEVQRLEKP